MRPQGSDSAGLSREQPWIDPPRAVRATPPGIITHDTATTIAKVRSEPARRTCGTGLGGRRGGVTGRSGTTALGDPVSKVWGTGLHGDRWQL